MSYFKNNEEVNQFNKGLAEETAKIKSGVNFIQLVATGIDKKSSFVCKYIPNMHYINYYDVLNIPQPIGKKSDYYYGLSPELSVKIITEHISKQTFTSIEHLKNFMKDNGHLFMLPKHKKYDNVKNLEALYAATILRIASRFGIKFYCDENTYNSFIEYTSNKPCFINEVTYKLFKPDKKTDRYAIALLGRPSIDLLNCMDDNYKIAYESESKLEYEVIIEQVGSIKNKTKSNPEHFIVKIKTTKTYTTFNEIYTSTENENLKQNFFSQLELCHGFSYYIGVLPRLKKIVTENNTYSNNNVQSFTLEIERTTFAMEDLFENIGIFSHPILSEYKTLLNDLDTKEIELQKKHIYEYSKNTFSGKTPILLESINNYLSVTTNPNIIGVSANITTKDNYSLLGLRSNDSIDEGTFYCSANGQSEIFDRNVSHYFESVYEDTPTLHIDSKYRIDFDDELSRETFAELSINDVSHNWDYCGISVLGIRVNENDISNKRRLHFNILAHASTQKTLYDVLVTWKKSTESFENKEIFGIKINYYNTIFNYIIEKIKSGIKLILNYKGIVTSSITIILFIYSIFQLSKEFSPITSIQTVFFSACVLFLSISDALKEVKRYRIVKDKRLQTNIIINSSTEKYLPLHIHEQIQKRIDKIDANKLYKGKSKNIKSENIKVNIENKKTNKDIENLDNKKLNKKKEKKEQDNKVRFHPISMISLWLWNKKNIG